MSFTVVYYTDNSLPEPFWRACVDQLNRAVCASSNTEPAPPEVLVMCNERIPWMPDHWRQEVVTGQRGLHDCYTKILAALRLARHEIVYLVEHDVLYPEGYFEHTPARGAFWFNHSTMRMNRHGFFTHGADITSACCGHKADLAASFGKRMEWIRNGWRIVWDEPGAYWPQRGEPGEYGYSPVYADVCPARHYHGERFVIDVRHGANLTGYREARNNAYLSELPYWGAAADWWRRFGL